MSLFSVLRRTTKLFIFFAFKILSSIAKLNLLEEDINNYYNSFNIYN